MQDTQDTWLRYSKPHQREKEEVLVNRVGYNAYECQVWKGWPTGVEKSLDSCSKQWESPLWVIASLLALWERSSKCIIVENICEGCLDLFVSHRQYIYVCLHARIACVILQSAYSMLLYSRYGIRVLMSSKMTSIWEIISMWCIVCFGVGWICA